MWASNPGRGKRFLFSSKRQDCLWGQRSFVFDGCRGSFPGAKRHGREVNHSPPSRAEVGCTCASLVWREQWHCRCVCRPIAEKDYWFRVCPSFRPHETAGLTRGRIFLILSIYWLYNYVPVETYKLWLQSDRINRHFSWRHTCMTLVTKGTNVMIPYLPVLWVLLWPGGGRGAGELTIFPKTLCVVFLFVLSYWFHLMKFRLFKVTCTLLTGRYVGSRPIKLRKSTWKQRNMDTVRKKEKEKTVLIGLLTGRWPKSDCGELLILLTFLCIHFVAVFKTGVQE